MLNILSANSWKGNKVVKVENFQHLLKVWDFLLSGLKAVQDNCQENLPDVTSEQFFKTLARLTLEPELGLILLLTSKFDKPLGYIVLLDVTEMYSPKTCCIYIAYSNGKCQSTILELRHEGVKWSKEMGFVKYRAFSYRIRPTPARISGAVRRYFSKTLGLRERCVVFEAPVQ